jgi:hypothetical protein
VDITRLEIKTISKIEAIELIFANHYSKIMPKLTEHYLGGFIDDDLVGVITLGWGVRPVHTIKLLFPSLSSKDYYEIGKMCMREDMPKNSESVFLSRTIDWIKTNTPACKVLFTWADGILGKPGYVYQASNFLYGGYIWTDLYITAEGEKVHPRTSQAINKRTTNTDKKYGSRPNRDELQRMGWRHFRGKQFRYVYFTCDKRTRKSLLNESTVKWDQPYPKAAELEWKEQDLVTGQWYDAPAISYNPSANNKNNVTVIRNTKVLAPVRALRGFFDF